MKTEMRPVGLTLSRWHYQAIRKIAAEREMSMSALARQIVMDYLVTEMYKSHREDPAGDKLCGCAEEKS